MSILHTANEGQDPLTDPSQQADPLNKKHLKLVERSIESLKAEQKAGTPVDPNFIAELEQQLERLKTIL